MPRKKVTQEGMGRAYQGGIREFILDCILERGDRARRPSLVKFVALKYRVQGDTVEVNLKELEEFRLVKLSSTHVSITREGERFRRSSLPESYREFEEEDGDDHPTEKVKDETPDFQKLKEEKGA